jgi:signal transduction histidine kinase
VLKGSKTIDQQRGQLTNQITELQSLLSQNEDLRHRLQRSNENVADINERLLRRVGSDLHDGPVQLLTYAMLRLHKLAPLAESSGPQSREDLQRMREAMGDALLEVRHISSGLALPELNVATLDEALSLAIAAHEQRTDTSVSADIPRLPADVPHALKICAYRFVQEALTNAFRHGGGKDQRVAARATNILEISVSDSGPGFSAIDIKSDRLGLSGLRARIEAIGGTLEIQSTPHTVTILKARFDLNELRAKEAV